MAISIYRNATNGSTNGTLEVPGDGVGLDIGQIGAIGIFHLRAPAGQQNAEAVTVNAPLDCEVSKDGSTWAATAVYAIGEITALNVPCYVKRVGTEYSGLAGLLSNTATVNSTAERPSVRYE